MMDSSITDWLEVLDNWILNINVLGIFTSYSNSLNTLNFMCSFCCFLIATLNAHENDNSCCHRHFHS